MSAARESCYASALQVGDVAALTETGPAVFLRVRNTHGYRDGSIVMQSTLTNEVTTWPARKQVWCTSSSNV